MEYLLEYDEYVGNDDFRLGVAASKVGQYVCNIVDLFKDRLSGLRGCIVMRAKNGDDYNVFDESGVVTVSTKDNRVPLEDLVNVCDIRGIPSNEAMMLYMDINERFGTLQDFLETLFGLV